MKKWIIFLVLIAVGVGWWIYRCVDFSKPVDLESYTPSEECAPAYGCLEQAIVQSADTTGYDIEQTVRIMNSFEVAYTDTHTVKLGVEFTPNRYDIRRFLKRWAYRAGFRYGTYHQTFGGQRLDQMAVTLGVGIPVKYRAFSSIDSNSFCASSERISV